jgi:hypothetical protein
MHVSAILLPHHQGSLMNFPRAWARDQEQSHQFLANPAHKNCEYDNQNKRFVQLLN